MESSTLPVIVSSLPACAPAARGRRASTLDARSFAGEGAYGVRGTWFDRMAGHTILAVDKQDSAFTTYNFTTRQGPPTCSPPV